MKNVVSLIIPLSRLEHASSGAILWPASSFPFVFLLCASIYGAYKICIRVRVWENYACFLFYWNNYARFLYVVIIIIPYALFYPSLYRSHLVCGVIILLLNVYFHWFFPLGLFLVGSRKICLRISDNLPLSQGTFTFSLIFYVWL